MRRWLDDRRSVPPGMPDPVPARARATTASVKSTTADTGAAHALKRLEQEERTLFRALQECRPEEARSVRKAWLQTAETLRKVDGTLGERRQGDQVSIPQSIAAFDASLATLEMAVGGLEESLGHVLASMSKDPETTYDTIRGERKRLLTCIEHAKTAYCRALSEASPVDGKRMLEVVFRRLDALVESVREAFIDLYDVADAGGALTRPLLDGVWSRVSTRYESLTTDREETK